MQLGIQYSVYAPYGIWNFIYDFISLRSGAHWENNYGLTRICIFLNGNKTCRSQSGLYPKTTKHKKLKKKIIYSYGYLSNASTIAWHRIKKKTKTNKKWILNQRHNFNDLLAYISIEFLDFSFASLYLHHQINWMVFGVAFYTFYGCNFLPYICCY